MKKLSVGFLAGMLTGVSCWVTLFAQDSRRRDFDRLPAPVTNTLHRLYPQAELHDVDTDGNGSERAYKLELRLTDKHHEAWIRVMGDGSLVESKEWRRTDQVPEPVSKALARVFPRGSVSEARIVTRTTVTYEVELHDGDRKHDVTFSPRGKILEIEK